MKKVILFVGISVASIAGAQMSFAQVQVDGKSVRTGLAFLDQSALVRSTSEASKEMAVSKFVGEQSDCRALSGAYVLKSCEDGASASKNIEILVSKASDEVALVARDGSEYSSTTVLYPAMKTAFEVDSQVDTEIGKLNVKSRFASTSGCNKAGLAQSGDLLARWTSPADDSEIMKYNAKVDMSLEVKGSDATFHIEVTADGQKQAMTCKYTRK